VRILENILDYNISGSAPRFSKISIFTNFTNLKALGYRNVCGLNRWEYRFFSYEEVRGPDGELIPRGPEVGSVLYHTFNPFLIAHRNSFKPVKLIRVITPVVFT